LIQINFGASRKNTESSLSAYGIPGLTLDQHLLRLAESALQQSLQDFSAQSPEGLTPKKLDCATQFVKGYFK
jgi:hypothetical protein